MTVGYPNLNMLPKRKHIRLSGFDYSSAAAYFITICVKNKENLFGEIRNGVMGLSEIGNIACLYLQRITTLRKYIELDEYVVMPNHIHFILVIKESDKQYDLGSLKANAFAQPIAGSVSVIVNQYKGAVKKWCTANGYTNFEWQSRFYDHIIRNDESFERIQNYIITNPINWEKDKLYQL